MTHRQATSPNSADKESSNYKGGQQKIFYSVVNKISIILHGCRIFNPK